MKIECIEEIKKLIEERGEFIEIRKSLMKSPRLQKVDECWIPTRYQEQAAKIVLDFVNEKIAWIESVLKEL